jgi:Fic family protein
VARGRPSRATVYERLERALAEFEGALGGLPPLRSEDPVWAETWHLDAHHSTALEGNTLALGQVEALLEQGRAVGAKPLKEYLEVQAYAAAARWVYEQGSVTSGGNDEGLITIFEVRRLHAMLLTPVWDLAPHPDAGDQERPGMFREHDIRPFAAGMTPPTWPLVPAMLQGWVDSVNRNSDNLRTRTGAGPWPELLAKIHRAFERIHPSIDGNGRAGRLLLNLVLVRLGYPPIIVVKRERVSYLAALQRSDKGDHGPLGELLARSMYDSLNRFILPITVGPDRLVPLAALVTAEMSVTALRQAAQRGRLEAIQGSDGVWRSSRSAVEAYRASRGQRGNR